MQSGVTGLTGASNQQFHEVAPLDYDPSLEVSIIVRLVCGDVPKVRKLVPVAGATTPPPVD